MPRHAPSVAIFLASRSLVNPSSRLSMITAAWRAACERLSSYAIEAPSGSGSPAGTTGSRFSFLVRAGPDFPSPPGRSSCGCRGLRGAAEPCRRRAGCDCDMCSLVAVFEAPRSRADARSAPCTRCIMVVAVFEAPRSRADVLHQRANDSRLLRRDLPGVAEPRQ